MNNSQMEIRSNTLFTSNEFRSSFVGISWESTVVPGLKYVMALCEKMRLKSHYMASIPVYNAAPSLLRYGI
ncbi:hypothetical protein [Pseudomonas frederiksbergensis]|uniref:hypothetical protein n=1 Tax=Pseudomonas frederiksbergensis TaxID=104087 RepID=UPI003D1F3C65